MGNYSNENILKLVVNDNKKAALWIVSKVRSQKLELCKRKFSLLLTSLHSCKGTIQVLRHHDFDLFWPTHPPYQQTSSFPIPTLMMTSSFPHTHPPINIFFLSLINKAKIRQGLFSLKKNYILHTNSGSFLKKKKNLKSVT